MKQTGRTTRVQGTGSDNWAVYYRAWELIRAGTDVVDLTIGEPDVDAPASLIADVVDSLEAGRVGYADGRGEPELRRALAEYYTERSGRPIDAGQVLCVPGTQSALFVAMMGVAETGSEVIVGDPMYATYDGVIKASGASMVPVALDPERGFRLDADTVEAAVTPATTALLLTTPHNPTGAVLTADDLAALCEVALRHDLWIISDEVYADFLPGGMSFHSPLDVDVAQDRVVVLSSISKSHAAPGFRSGWCVGPQEFIDRLLPYAEAMLFGNQPFIADATTAAIRDGSSVVAGMIERFAARAAMLAERLHAETSLQVRVPKAGMFAMVDVSSTGMSGEAFAHDLVERGGVAVMPGSSFGTTVSGWVRVSLTVDDDRFAEACDRICAHVKSLG